MAVMTGELWRASILAVAGDQTAYNVVHFRVQATGGGLVTEQEWTDAFATRLDTALINLLPSSTSYWGVLTQKFNPLPVSNTYRNTAFGAAGALSAECLPRQVAGMFTKRTMYGGPGGRGRVYVPFPSEEANDATFKPNAGYMTSLGIYASRLTTTLVVTGASTGTATMVPILWKPKFGDWYDLIGVTARQKWATQRRRGSYGRQNSPPS